MRPNGRARFPPAPTHRARPTGASPVHLCAVFPAAFRCAPPLVSSGGPTSPACGAVPAPSSLRANRASANPSRRPSVGCASRAFSLWPSALLQASLAGTPATPPEEHGPESSFKGSPAGALSRPHALWLPAARFGINYFFAGSQSAEVKTSLPSFRPSQLRNPLRGLHSFLAASRRPPASPLMEVGPCALSPQK